MTLPENDRGRPGANRTASKMSDDDKAIVLPIDDQIRCTRCGHVVWSPESVAAGVGRDCRRLLRRVAREVAA